MNTYEFELRFSLPATSQNPEDFISRLAEAGCTDALVGIGQAGRLALQFTRDANSAFEAIMSAINNIKSAIPEASLIEAAPDFVGLTDIADILGHSRQNIRKLMMNNLASFPTPIHQGKTMLWHLSSILSWVKQSNRYEVDEMLLDVASTNMQLNIVKETVHLDATIREQLVAGI
jgi:predicted DNA-binding transcriptional regulator AlpA